MTPTPTVQDTQPTAPRQAEFQALLHEKMRLAIRLTLVDVLEDEVTAFIGAPAYERGAHRRDQRNGSYTRDLGTTVGQLEDLPVPRTRQGFRTQLFERYQRRQAQLDAAIGEMFVFGVSMTRVGEVVETLTGLTPSPSTVSRVFHKLDTEFEAWKARPLVEHYAYVFADGTYFTIIYDGAGAKMPVLAVVGIRADGTREVLAFTVGERENQAAWADLFADLKRRGVKVIDLTISDGGQATAALPRQRLHPALPDDPAPTLRQTQNRERLGLYPRGPAGYRRARTQGHLLSGRPRRRRSRSRGLPRKVRPNLPLRARMSRPRLGGLPDLLCLPQDALENHPHQQCH